MEILTRTQLETKIKESKKGMLILGAEGVGKTHAIKDLNKRMVNAQRLTLQYQMHGITALRSLIQDQIEFGSNDIVIDDIGTEKLTTKNYGSELSVVEFLIHRIYDLIVYNDAPFKLWLTSNLNLDELKTVYGPRVLDRLHELCDIVVLEDTNLRK